MSELRLSSQRGDGPKPVTFDMDELMSELELEKEDVVEFLTDFVEYLNEVCLGSSRRFDIGIRVSPCKTFMPLVSLRGG